MQMEARRILFKTVFLCASVLLTSCGYSSVEECVLKELKGGSPQQMAAARAFCKSEVQRKVVEGTILPPEQLSKIDGKAGIYGSNFSADIYNGSDYDLLSITISIATKKEPQLREYRIRESIPSKTAVAISAPVVSLDGEILWNIAEAKGVISH